MTVSDDKPCPRQDCQSIAAENARLLAAAKELDTYADHTFTCAIVEAGKDYDPAWNPIECTCGLDAAERAMFNSTDAGTSL